MKHILIVLILSTIHFFLSAQERQTFYQSITGVVYDAATTQPLNGVNIVIKNQSGTVSDSKGYFSLKSKTGRTIIELSHIGYDSQSISVLVMSAQESRIKVFLEPKISELSEVVIKAPFRKEMPLNRLIYASGRSFSTTEANRYAGSLGDPARMVQNYAGVTSVQDERNDIIIRGNSPIGTQWRLNGIEVPNPNHYGGIGLTGNRVTLLNMNMVDNSDFLKGAFPAEYSNALSGVFDLKLKQPNPDKYEFRGQVGWNGFELGVEGPFSKKKNIGSHMTCYRYSFLDVMSKMGANMGTVPEYQDLTTNLHFKLSENTDMSVLGLWGTSQIQIDDRDQKNLKAKTGQYLNTGSDLLLGGINLNYKINTHNTLNFSASALNNEVTTFTDTFNIETDATAPIWREKSSEKKYSFAANYKSYALSKNYLTVGLKWDTYHVNFKQDGINWNDEYTTLTNSDKVLNLLRLYAQDEYRLSPKLRATIGLNFQYLLYNETYSLEPRAALRYRVDDKQSLAFAYGVHGQMQPRITYFIETPTAEGILLTNKNLDFSKANHYVLSYNLSIAKNLHFKTEAYYQDLYNIPVKNDKNSTFSLLNTGADYYIPPQDSLVNAGKGQNYGIELTLEKFLSNNYYYMLTGTFFSSKYAASDNIWRSTAFNLSHIVNGLFGYEYWISNNFAVGADLKMTWAGGKPYTPVNETESINSGNVVYYENRAYKERYDDYFRTDLKIYYRQNHKKAYLEFAIDFQNLTNHKNIDNRRFEPTTGEYVNYYQMSFFPMYTFKVLF